MNGIRKRTAKALVGGVALRDYTGWKEDGGDYGPRFVLELGHGFRLTAEVSGDPADTCDVFSVMHRDAASKMRVTSSDINLFPNEFTLYGEDGSFTAELGYFDPDVFVESMIESPIRYGYRFEGFDGKRTLAIVRGKGKYAGDTSVPSESSFSRGYLDNLCAAVFRQDFSRLDDSRDYDDVPEEPATVTFEGVKGAKYCSDIKVRVFSDDGPFSYTIDGVLSSDGDGVVVMGSDASYTFLVPPDLRGWGDGGYLRDHPAPDWSSCVKDPERLRKAMDGGPERGPVDDGLGIWT